MDILGTPIENITCKYTFLALAFFIHVGDVLS